MIFHELGHCVLDREHDDSYQGGKKSSLMHSSIGGHVYKRYEEEYLDELFEIE